MASSTKEFVDPDRMFHDSFLLARRVHESGWRPDVVLALWRGGAPVGAAVHEYFRYRGWNVEHGVAKAESYEGMEQQEEVRLQFPEGFCAAIPARARVLIVDDIFDTGRTVHAVCRALEARNVEIRVATLYYKPSRRVGHRTPDYYITETDRWVVFPHEIVGLSDSEIQGQRPLLWEVVGHA